MKAETDQGHQEPERPPGLRTEQQLREVTAVMLPRPPGLPLWETALNGLLLMLRALIGRWPSAQAIYDAVKDRFASLSSPIPPEKAEWAKVHIVSKHAELYAAIEVTDRARRDQPQRQATLALMAVWGLRVLMGGKPPATATVAAARRQAERSGPEAELRKGDQQADRQLRASLRQLEDLIRSSPALAMRYGLTAPKEPVSDSGSIASFNRRLQAHRTKLVSHAKARDHAGTAGHGGLTDNEMLQVGAEVLAGVLADDPQAVLDAIQIRTELSAPLIALLPVQLGPEPPSGALAWVDLDRGCYCFRLNKVFKKGQLPAREAQSLYHQTSQIVRIRLMDPVVAALESRRPKSATQGWIALGPMLGVAPTHGRRDIARIGMYHLTAKKCQRALAGRLLARGHDRWSIALATQNFLLVAEAKEYYSAIPAETVEAANAEIHAVYGWPAPSVNLHGCTHLIGSRVVLKQTAIQRLFASISAAADSAPLGTTVASVRRSINAHARLVGLTAAFCLCLREWEVYQLSPIELARALEVALEDKGVHLHGEAATPVVELLRRVCAAWLDFLRRASALLVKTGDPEGVALAAQINSMCSRTDGQDRLFIVGKDNKLHMVGHRVWVNGLPPSLRVRGNVFRHYWPLQLHLAGLWQLQIDVLMRHQVPGIHAATAHIVGTADGRRTAIATAMNLHIDHLGLAMPREFKGEQQ